MGQIRQIRGEKRRFRTLRKRLRVSACYGMLADVALLARESEGFGLIWGTFGMLTLPTATNEHHHRPTYCAYEPPDPSGGNAAVVRDKKVMRLSVLPDIRGGLPFYPSPLPYRFRQKECCRFVRLLSFCFSRMGVECKEVQWNGGLASGA